MYTDYQLLAENCREVEKIWRFAKRTLNDRIRKNKSEEIVYQTKMLLLIYCSLAESYFYKILNTPNSLNSDEIQQVKEAMKNGIVWGWKKCVDLGLRKSPSQHSSYVPNVRQRLDFLINQFIFEPSQIRNKFAHGQWYNAFNRDVSRSNPDTTHRVQSLSSVEIELNKYVLEKLTQIVTDIMVSPEKAQMRDYYPLLCDLENEVKRRSDWDKTSKKRVLNRKAPKKQTI